MPPTAPLPAGRGGSRHNWLMKRAILVADDLLPEVEPPAAPWPARQVMLDGSMLQVRDTAATAEGAEPAVYLHGLGGSTQNWTDLAA